MKEEANMMKEIAINLDVNNIILEAYPIEEYDPIDLQTVFDKYVEYIMSYWEVGYPETAQSGDYEEESFLEYLYEEYEFSHAEWQLILLNVCLDGSISRIIAEEIEYLEDARYQFYNDCFKQQEAWELEREELIDWYNSQRM